MSLHNEDTRTLLTAIDRFAQARILCVGDVMLDRFVYGEVERISPEAPIPVMRATTDTVMLGGAGNVVRNMSSLSASVSFISVVGDDDTGRTIAGLSNAQQHVASHLVADTRRRSTEKIRYIAGSQQMLRVDREDASALSESMEQQILEQVKQALPDMQLVVLSDYGKGVLSPAIISEVMKLASEQNIPVIVDPKSRDFSRYRGAWLLSPNLKELREATGEDLSNNEAIIAAARGQMQQCDITNMIVTCGPRGMLVVPAEGEAEHIAAHKREVYDVSGAGDTVLATLAASLATGLELPDAAYLANLAAGIVVGRMGTATVYRTDLKTAVHTDDVTTGSAKIYPLDLAAEQVESWQHDALAVGFTNGCFDLVHAGHLALLADAKAQCDRLIVAINSDDSVKRLKGESRPVNGEMERALLLAELQVVDMVVIFREDTPMEVLERLKPDVLMKGGDYTLDQVVGRDLVESLGGRVLTIPLREGYSTTSTIEKIIKKA